MPSTTFFNLPEEKRERLLQAAREEFSRVPYDEASINRIIHTAGIPRGSFYMYFTDKEDLFRYLLEDYLHRFSHLLRGMLAEKQGDLFAAFRTLFDWIVQQDGSENPLTEPISILHLNAGLQQGPLLRSLDARKLMEQILPEIDQSRLSLRREGDLEEIVLILISVTMPALCAARQGADRVRERYLARLDILSRGMAAETVLPI